MPVDFRYHLASLLAVFCALLIGILLGIALVGDPSLENQLRDFRKERQRNRDTIVRLTKSESNNLAFGRQVLPYLIDTRLQGMRVAVILNRDIGDRPWVEQVLMVIRQAGGQITSTTSIRPDFLELDQEHAAPVLSHFGFPLPIDGDPRSILAGKLAVRIAEGDSALPFRLRQLGVIGVDGDYERPADVVLLIGGTDGDLSSANAVDLPMIRALQETAKRVVACEATVRPEHLSCMRAYQRRAISTIDDVDTGAGQLALVLVLAGASGNFGVNNTADHLLPPIPSPSGR